MKSSSAYAASNLSILRIKVSPLSSNYPAELHLDPDLICLYHKAHVQAYKRSHARLEFCTLCSRRISICVRAMDLGGLIFLYIDSRYCWAPEALDSRFRGFSS